MMHIPTQRMFPLSIVACLSLLLLSQFADCSLNESRSILDDSINKQNVNSHKRLDMLIHGILLWASMGFLMPVGIVVMRMSSKTKNCNPTRNKMLFYAHVILQVLSVILVTIGAILSIRKFENAFNNNHQRIGLGLYGSIYLQVLMGFRKPKRGTRGRMTWYFLHWILGTTISIVGVMNTYIGLQAYHKKTAESVTIWSIIFIAQVSFMSILYLFQDKWEYIQKQGIVHDGGAVVCAAVDRIESQKETLDEPRRKSNALGTHFSRTNALHKLFQLT